MDTMKKTHGMTHGSGTRRGAADGSGYRLRPYLRFTGHPYSLPRGGCGVSTLGVAPAGVRR